MARTRQEYEQLALGLLRECVNNPLLSEQTVDMMLRAAAILAIQATKVDPVPIGATVVGAEQRKPDLMLLPVNRVDEQGIAPYSYMYRHIMSHPHKSGCKHYAISVEHVRTRWLQKHPDYCRVCNGVGILLDPADESGRTTMECPTCMALPDPKCPWCMKEVYFDTTADCYICADKECGWMGRGEATGLPPAPECICNFDFGFDYTENKEA